jgi:hypothetical protein
MSFYSPSEREFSRLYVHEVEMAFSAMDCVLCGEAAIYASTELTTGVRLYDAMRKTDTKTASQLREKMGREWYTVNVWDANIASAMAFAAELRRGHDNRTQVITPAPFTAPDWTQPEYLAFWETLLRDSRRIGGASFNRNWQFSNGCTFEFAVAQDAGLSTVDHEGQVLDLDQAIDLVGDAISVLNADGFDTRSLEDNLNRLVVIRQREQSVVKR